LSDHNCCVLFYSQQFDGADFVDLTAGTFLLWSAPMRDFEVHTRVTNGRNCGVAMRDSCDLVVMDRCSGSAIVRTDFKATIPGHPIVTRMNGGSTYIVSARHLNEYISCTFCRYLREISGVFNFVMRRIFFINRILG
jgi:hypothetical protein